MRLPELTFDVGGQVQVAAAPIWAELYVPILLALIAGIGLQLVDLLRPWRTLMVSSVDLAINVGYLIILTWLLRADRYLDITGAPENADKVTRANYWANQSIEWALLVVGAIVIFELCYELWRMLQARRSSV